MVVSWKFYPGSTLVWDLKYLANLLLSMVTCTSPNNFFGSHLRFTIEPVLQQWLIGGFSYIYICIYICIYMYCFSTLNALDDWLIWLLFSFIAIAISLSTRNRKLRFTQRIVTIHSQNLLELPVLRGKLAWNILVVLPGDSSNLRAGASPFARQTVKPCRCWIYTPSLSLKLKDSNGALNYSRLKQENNWIAASKIRMSSCVFNKNRGCTQQFFCGW